MTPREATWRAAGGGATPVRRAVPDDAPTTREAVSTTPWSRLEIASATSCGGVHRQNEDAHSDPGRDGALFVVAVAPFEPHKIYYLPTPYHTFGAGRALMQAMQQPDSHTD